MKYGWMLTHANNSICQFILIKKSEIKFAIIVLHVDDLNFIKTPKKFKRTTYLKNEFKMKDFEQNFVLAYSLSMFQVKYLSIH